MAITLGSNLKTTSSLGGFRKLMRLMNSRDQIAGGRPRRHNIPIYTKAGTPATNTAADDPGAAPAFILDTTNNIVYICSGRTNSTTFTIRQVFP